LRSYEIALRLRLLPELGGRRVSEIRPADVQDFADRLVTHGEVIRILRVAVVAFRSIVLWALAGESARRPPAVRRAGGYDLDVRGSAGTGGRRPSRRERRSRATNLIR
jgi:hypothetical protein